MARVNAPLPPLILEGELVTTAYEKEISKAKEELVTMACGEMIPRAYGEVKIPQKCPQKE